MYLSFMKEHPWVEHLTCLPKRGMGTLLSVSAFYHERAPVMFTVTSMSSKQIIVQEYITEKVCNSHMVSVPAIWTSG